ncbi:unnamed protein product [Boreogadus saida]
MEGSVLQRLPFNQEDMMNGGLLDRRLVQRFCLVPFPHNQEDQTPFLHTAAYTTCTAANAPLPLMLLEMDVGSPHAGLLYSYHRGAVGVPLPGGGSSRTHDTLEMNGWLPQRNSPSAGLACHRHSIYLVFT